MSFDMVTMVKQVTETKGVSHVCNGNVQRKSKSAELVESVPKLSVLPCVVISAERVELQTCLPMYAKSMAKGCSLLSSASEHILYHCHSHFGVQVCSKVAYIDLKKKYLSVSFSPFVNLHENI